MTFSWQNIRNTLVAALLAGAMNVPAQAIELTNSFEAAEGRIEPVSASSVFVTQQVDPVPENAQPVGNAYCAQCGDPRCNGRCAPNWCAEECPRIGLQLFGGFEAWHGVSDAPNEGNSGFVSGFNAGASLIDSLGLGAQFGLSSGIYDWMGRTGNGPNEGNKAQTQLIFSYGIFRRACGDRLQAGVVQDWMINDNFGTLSQEPTLSQWRAQLGFILNEGNEIGVWAAWRDRGMTQSYFSPLVPVSYRAITQTNLFWHSKWRPGGTDSWLWWGVPAYGRLNQTAGGSIGEFTLGGAMNVPVTSRIAAYANMQYMKPSSRGGVAGSNEDFFDLGFGLSFVPGGTRTRNVTGQKSMPLMPVANNGSFLVDRSL